MREAIPLGSRMMEAGEGVVCWRMRGGGNNTGDGCCGPVADHGKGQRSGKTASASFISLFLSTGGWHIWAWHGRGYLQLLVVGPWWVSQAEGALGSGVGSVDWFAVFFPFGLEKDVRKGVVERRSYPTRVYVAGEGGRKGWEREGKCRLNKGKCWTKSKQRKREKIRSSSTGEIWKRRFDREGCSVGAITTHTRRQSFSLSRP